MTLHELVSDIMLVLSKSTISKDFRVSKRHIRFLVNQYRARKIQDDYKTFGRVMPEYMQDLGILQVTKINSGDDTSIPYTSLTLGKISIPPIVSLPDEDGLVRVSSSSRQMTYYPIEMPLFFDLVPDSIQTKFPYYFKVGIPVYLHPYIQEVNMIAVLDDPLDGYVFRTENVFSGNLTIGDLFVVTSGSIQHNTVVYTKGQNFTAVNANFIGTGTVQYQIKKRKMTIFDPYPASIAAGEYIALSILTKEFGIEEKQIADIKNDAKDQLAVLNDGN